MSQSTDYSLSKVAEKITNATVRVCNATSCKFNVGHGCNLSFIPIASDATCGAYVKKDKPKGMTL